MTSVRHHYVPQGYLRGFADENDSARSHVWVYDKQAGRTPRRKAIRSIAWAPDYYAQESEGGSDDLDTVEKNLAQTIDNRIPLILGKLNARVGRLVEMSEDDKGALSFFVGLSLTRVPSFRDGMNEFHKRVVETALSYQLEKDARLCQISEDHGIEVSVKPWVSLRPMVQIASQISLSALKKSWQFFIPPADVPFVTSDNPVVLSGVASGLTQDYGPAHPGVELVINLRKDLALVCTPKRGYSSMSVFALTPTEARKFNRGVVRAARQRVFSSQKSDPFDAFVKKYAGEEQRIVV
jgi:hypothetical protein